MANRRTGTHSRCSRFQVEMSSLSCYRHEEFVQSSRKRNAPEDNNRTVVVEQSNSELPLNNKSPVAVKKKSRKIAKYLQHDERCQIIKRIDCGETQASLAREFGVTRAAVNQLYKKRDKILSRGSLEHDTEGQSPLADTQVAPFRKMSATHSTIPQNIKFHPGVGANLQLQNVQDRPETKVVLLKKLREAQTSDDAFQRASTRLTFILIEEAFARYDNYPRQSISCPGRADFCGITLGTECESFLKAFLQIDAYALSGQIDVKRKRDDYTNWQLAYLDVPDNIIDLNILLFSASGLGGAECRAIAALRSIGVQEHKLSLVMVVCTTNGYKEITTRFPNVAVFTAGTEDNLALDRCPCPSIR